MKLLRTNLLKKYKDTSFISLATASHFDVIKHEHWAWVKMVFDWSQMKGKMIMVWESILICLIGLSFIPLVVLIVLTCGWIMAPYEYFRHVSYQKLMIQEYGVDKINEQAAELVKEYSQEKAKSIEVTNG